MITRRGWIVIGIAIVVIAWTIGYLTRDVCWVGLDLVSCNALLDEVMP